MRQLGLSDNVIMAGYQTSEEFTPALRNADVCVAPDPPSPFNDISTMNKIVEYMALGRPCVAFGLPENKVTGADAAAYADEPTVHSLARVIARLLDDERERARMGARARERFTQVLAWEHSALELRRAYERLREKVAARRGRPAAQP